MVQVPPSADAAHPVVVRVAALTVGRGPGGPVATDPLGTVIGIVYDPHHLEVLSAVTGEPVAITGHGAAGPAVGTGPVGPPGGRTADLGPELRPQPPTTAGASARSARSAVTGKYARSSSIAPSDTR